MPGARDVLACPSCRGTLTWTDSAAICSRCSRSYAIRGAVADFAPDIVDSPSLAQRLMESRAVATVYERGVRPLLTHLVSPIGYSDEDAFLSTWSAEPRDAPALDLSCGTGRYTRWLAARFGAANVVGLDLSPAMLAECRRENAAHAQADITLVRGTALALPIGDGALAAVNCFGALHLYPDPAHALAEVGRVLAPEGRFTCLTTAVGDERRDHIWAGLMRRVGVRPFDLAELERNLGVAGLAPLEMRRAGEMVVLAATPSRI